MESRWPTLVALSLGFLGVNENVNAKTKHALSLLNLPNDTINRDINHHIEHICFGFKILGSCLRYLKITPKLTHNSTTTAIRIVRRHGYVHRRHVMAVFIHKLIHSHVKQ